MSDETSSLKCSKRKFIDRTLEIDELTAGETGNVGYMSRVFVQMTLPHTKPTSNEFKRVNGSAKVTMMADSEIGLPYGCMPRLILAWLSTEAIRTQSREIELPKSMNIFLKELGLVSVGGKHGSISRLKDQVKRLFSTRISYVNDRADYFENTNFDIATKSKVWWTPKKINDDYMQSSVILHEVFYSELIAAAVPIDMRALLALKQSPLAMDVYLWLTYRVSYLSNTTIIPWLALQNQFGAEYSRSRDFKANFLIQLKKVRVVYPEVKAYEKSNGLMLMPSSPHIKKKLKKQPT